MCPHILCSERAGEGIVEGSLGEMEEVRLIRYSAVETFDTLSVVARREGARVY